MFSLQNVEVTLGGKKILTGIELDLQQGSRVTVAGRSGPGNSTLPEPLCFLVRSSANRITFHGLEADPPSLPSLRRIIPLTRQEPLLRGETVSENITGTFGFRSAAGKAPHPDAEARQVFW